jgi:hypothetical protein
MSKSSHRIKNVVSIMFVGCAALFASGYAVGLTLTAPTILTQTGITVGMVGTTAGMAKGTSVLISPNPNGCLNNTIDFINPLNQVEESKALSVAMVAKLTVKTVRIDFTQSGGAGTQCLGAAIFLE